MQINRSIRQALFAPEVQTEPPEDFVEYININPCLDTRLFTSQAEACALVELGPSTKWPDKILLHVNVMGIPIDAEATVSRIDGNRSIGMVPLYSPESAYDREGTELIKIALYKALEVTYAGNGSAMFLTADQHQELSIEADLIANNSGKVLIPSNNIIYTKPFAHQSATRVEEKWRRDASFWALDFPLFEGANGAPILASLHAFGGIWHSELSPAEMEQVYFQITNNGGKTRVHPTKTSSWQTDSIDPHAKFSNVDGTGVVCWDDVSDEQHFSLEQAVANGFARISLAGESGQTCMYKSSQILRSVIDTKTFDMYFLRMEEI
ncbi:MAG: hypothetical protein LBL30_03505 [Holosporales bacterium]|jgi:hypothetical protein|nr:hypothetical protein [Holosporales bacterium]